LWASAPPLEDHSAQATITSFAAQLHLQDITLSGNERMPPGYANLFWTTAQCPKVRGAYKLQVPKLSLDFSLRQ